MRGKIESAQEEKSIDDPDKSKFTKKAVSLSNYRPAQLNQRSCGREEAESLKKIFYRFLFRYVSRQSFHADAAVLVCIVVTRPS